MRAKRGGTADGYAFVPSGAGVFLFPLSPQRPRRRWFDTAALATEAPDTGILQHPSLTFPLEVSS